jgi:hypothetical protein
LNPYVYSVPLAAKANLGIPLGIVIAPSEKQKVFSMFADILAEKGFSREELFRLRGAFSSQEQKMHSESFIRNQ